LRIAAASVVNIFPVFIFRILLSYYSIDKSVIGTFEITSD